MYSDAMAKLNQDLLKYIGRSLEDEEEFHFLRFESLQRTNIAAQQVELLGLKMKFQDAQNSQHPQDVTENDLKNLKTVLKDYGKSWPATKLS